MLTHKYLILTALFIAIFLNFNTAWSDSDMKGSKDHPKIPRIEGTTIFGFSESSYGEGVFMSGASGNELVSENVEGKRTRIVYIGPKDLSPLGVLRNYQKALEDLGEVEEVYTCKGNDCFKNLGDAFIWRDSNQIPTVLGGLDHLYGFGYKDQIYWYGKITTPASLFHVSVYSAVNTPADYIMGNWAGKTRNHPLIHLEVIEVSDFKPALEVVTANDMTKKISEKGHIALYGIYFDFDSDVLKTESDPTFGEIAKALNADTSLNIYVVGHTDNKGTLDYNEDLSKRRAKAVVGELTKKYGIDKERLVPVGVGLAAPVATNDTEEGRALNRRVELVKR
jgi:OOP family OmpA-OmpF porin